MWSCKRQKRKGKKKKNTQKILNSVTFEQNTDWQAHTDRTVIIAQITFNKSKHFILYFSFIAPYIAI